MYSLPPAVLFNEQTGRLELCHVEIARRMRRTQRLRSRYRSHLTRRAFRFVFALPRRGLSALAAQVRRRLDAPPPVERFN